MRVDGIQSRERGCPHPHSSLLICKVIIIAIFSALTLLPILAEFAASFWEGEGFSADAYERVLSEPRQWGLLCTSVFVASLTAILAGVIGTLLGFLLEYNRLPARKIFYVILTTSFLAPPYVNAIAWLDLLKPDGLLRKIPGLGGVGSLCSAGGVIFILTLAFYPIVVFMTVASIRRLDGRLEESASLWASRCRVLRSITLPLIMPGALTGCLIVFVLALISFSVPSLLQVNTYPVEIYTQFSGSYNIQEAFAQACPNLIIGGALFILWRTYLRPKYAWLGCAQRHRPKSNIQRGAQAVSLALCWTVLLISFLVPLASLIKQALPLSSYKYAWDTAKEEILTSAIIASSAASLNVFLSLFLGYLLAPWRFGRMGQTFRMGVDFVAVLPFLISGPVFGVGLILLWNHSGPASIIYDTFAVLVFACAGRYLFVCVRGINAGFAEIHRNAEEAASVLGVPWWRRLLGIHLRLLIPTLIATWAITFAFAFSELDCAVLVSPPGCTPLPVRIFTLMHYGPSGLVAALCVITIAVGFAAIALAAVCRFRIRGLPSASD